MGQPRFHPKGAKPTARPSPFWDLLHALSSMRNGNQILHTNQTRCEEIFYQLTTCTKVFVLLYPVSSHWGRVRGFRSIVQTYTPLHTHTRIVTK